MMLVSGPTFGDDAAAPKEAPSPLQDEPTAPARPSRTTR